MPRKSVDHHYEGSVNSIIHQCNKLSDFCVSRLQSRSYVFLVGGSKKKRQANMFNPTCLFAGSRDGEESSEGCWSTWSFLVAKKNQKPPWVAMIISVFEVILKGAGYCSTKYRNWGYSVKTQLFFVNKMCFHYVSTCQVPWTSLSLYFSAACSMLIILNNPKTPCSPATVFQCILCYRTAN